MSNIAPFKFEIRNLQKNITFGYRTLGQQGQDILAVKMALGVVQDLQGILSINSEAHSREDDGSIPLDPEGWFDCVTGRGIDVHQAATFDERLKNALINYQIKNQFLILCYLFQKYAVMDLIGEIGENYTSFLVIEEYSRGILRQLAAITELFDKELGNLGEATLAVLHGWLPHSIFSNSGYIHDPMVFGGMLTVTDVIPEVLHSEFTTGRFGQTKEDLIALGAAEDSFSLGDPEKLSKYLFSVSEDQKWLRGDDLELDAVFPYGSIDYRVLSDTESVLYRSSIAVMENHQARMESAAIMEDEQRRQHMRKVFYPDPFSTTEPFYIDEFTIGFYYETEFLLSPEGPLPNEREETIKDLEDKALNKILEFYKKPNVWYLEKNSEEIKNIYFSQRPVPPGPRHNGFFPEMNEKNSRGIKLKVSKYIQLDKQIKNKKKAIRDLEKEHQRLLESASERYLDEENSQIDDVKGKIEEKRQELVQLDLRFKFPLALDQETKMTNFWVLGTSAGLSRFNSVPYSSPENLSQTYVDSWRSLEVPPEFVPPLIEFVEYKTPTMRVGQKYRALLEVNREKLDAIVLGVEEEKEQTPEIPSQSTDTQIPEGCADQNTSETLRTLEEYRVHARSQRRNMVRKIRERLQNEETFHSMGAIDMGVIGPFDLNNALSSALGGNISGADDYEYTKTVLSALGDRATSLLQGLDLVPTDIEYFNNITDEANKPSATIGDPGLGTISLTLEEFSERIETIVKDLKESNRIIQEQGIPLAPGSKFDALRESILLKQFESQFIDLLGVAVSKLYGKTVWTHMSNNPGKTTIEITFAPVRPKNVALGPERGQKIIGLAAALPQYKTVAGMDANNQGTVMGMKADPYRFKNAKGIQKHWLHHLSAEETAKLNPKMDKYRADFLSFSEVSGIVSKSKVLGRPRTVNYIRKIKEMTGLTTDKPNEIISLFDDGRGSCEGLGFNVEKRLASSYLGKYTSGVKVGFSQTDKTGKSWSTIGRENFVEPWGDWWAQTSQNWKERNSDQFSEDNALKVMGDLCTLEELYAQFFDKLDLASLLCDYLKCIRLPGFSLKLPSFHLPPLPQIPVWGWYGEIWKFFKEKFFEILTRLVCTFAKTIIDKIAVPFCVEQLREFIAAGTTTDSPLVQQAFTEALTETGTSFSGKERETKVFFDEVASLTTGQELCHLLEGNNLDDASMLMVRRLAEKNNLADESTSNEDIVNFFGVVGNYMPCDLLEQVSKSDTMLFSESCIEVSQYLSDIRNRLQTSDTTLSEEEIEATVQRAKEEMDKRQQEMRAFSGGNVGAAMPTYYEPGNPNAIISDYPDFMKDDMTRNIRNLFQSARISYVDGLNSYVPAMSIDIPQSPRAGTAQYSSIQALKFEAALTQMSMYASALESKSIVQVQQVADAEGHGLTIEQVQALGEQDVSLAKVCKETINVIERYINTLNQKLYTGNAYSSQRPHHDRIIGRSLPNGQDEGPRRRWPLANSAEIWRSQAYSESVQDMYEFFEVRMSNRFGQIDIPIPLDQIGAWPVTQVELETILDVQPDQGPGRTVRGEFPYPGAIYETDFTEHEQRQVRPPEDIVDVGPSDSPADPDNRIYREPEQIRKILQCKEIYLQKIGIIEREKRSNRPEESITVDTVLNLVHPAESELPDWARWISFLESIKAAAEARKDIIDKAVAAPPIYWFDVMLLYAQFEHDFIPPADASTSDPQIVHKRYRMKKNLPTSRKFSAAVRRPHGSALDAQIQRPEITIDLFARRGRDREGGEIIMEDTPAIRADMERILTARQTMDDTGDALSIHSIYSSVFDKVQTDDADRRTLDYEGVGYETYYDSLNNPDSNDDFVLAAKSLEQMGLVGDGETFYSLAEQGPGQAELSAYGGRALGIQWGLFAAALDNPLPILTENPNISWQENALRSTNEVVAEIAFAMGLVDSRSEFPYDEPDEISELLQAMTNRPNDPGLLRLIKTRIEELINGASEVLKERRPIMASKHLLMLERAMKEKSYLETTKRTVEPGVEQTTTDLGFETDIAYQPSIKMIEHQETTHRDRYDIEISSDFHLGLPNSASKKIFKFCDGLPTEMTQHNEAQANQKYYSKKEAFSQMVIRAAQAPFDQEFSQSWKDKTRSNIYRISDGSKREYARIANSIMGNIFEELKGSRLFDAQSKVDAEGRRKDSYAQALNKRVKGDMIRDDEKKCVSNRYRLIESSILSFDKVILKETYREIMSEVRKPENSPYNLDFDDPGPIKHAMKAISLKAFVRICLLDTMLKGGLAYAVWDIEPVVSSSLFQEYVTSHILYELNKSRMFQDTWKQTIQRMMGVSNANISLRKLISEEIIKLPNYSKQVFNPNVEGVDFFNWYFEKHVPFYQVAQGPTREIDFESQNLRAGSWPAHRGFGYGEGTKSGLRKQRFFFEEYVELSGEILNAEFIDSLTNLEDAFAARRIAEGGQLSQNELRDFGPYVDAFIVEDHALHKISVHTFNSLIRKMLILLPDLQYRNILENSTIKHGIRLVLSFPDGSGFWHQTEDHAAARNMPADLLNNVARRERSYILATTEGEYSQDPEAPEWSPIHVPCIPLVIEERTLDIESCPSAFFGSFAGIKVEEARKFMKERLMESEDFNYLFEYMFPIRRYLSVQSMFATSILSGYSDVPGIFGPTKVAIAFISKIASTPNTEASSLMPISQEQFANFMKQNWPTSEDPAECFDFPGFGADFFIKFIEDLWKLIKQLPSVLLRGLANIIEPGYKEMRAHYFNCDLDSLKLDSVGWFSRKDKLTTGLKKTELPGSGRYIPLVPAAGFDLVESIAHWDWHSFGRTIAKVISYAYSGYTPFLDLHFAFKVPCNDELNKDWQEGGKYDIGSYGRYGHPLGPFAYAALLVPELDSDVNTKEGVCIARDSEEEYDECEE